MFWYAGLELNLKRMAGWDNVKANGALCGKPRGIFAEPCEARHAIPCCGKPQGFLAKKGEQGT